MELTCTHCNVRFSTLSNRNKHIKRAACPALKQARLREQQQKQQQQQQLPQNLLATVYEELMKLKDEVHEIKENKDVAPAQPDIRVPQAPQVMQPYYTTDTAAKVDGDDLMVMLRNALSTDEQRTFVDHFSMYLHVNKDDFVIDLDNVYEWIGFSSKGAAKRALDKALKQDFEFKVLLCRSAKQNPHESYNNVLLHSLVEQNPPHDTRGGINREQVLMTVKGFKKFCLAAGTEKARRLHEYYITMEEVLFEYTKKQLKVARAELENNRHEKTYVELPKNESIYINKAESELYHDQHKIGRAVNPTRRERELNTAHARPTKMIYTRPTVNADIVEKILKVVLKKYHCGTNGGQEHYWNNLEHSIACIDIASTVIDTLASSNHVINRNDMLRMLMNKFETLMETQLV